MNTMLYGSLRKNVGVSLLTLLTIAFMISCKKSDSDIEPKPVISYKQKIINIAEDVPMMPVRPDSTGGAITDYAINPMLPKGLAISKTNGVISGTPSDTLSPTQYVVTATGPGGRATDTLTLLVGTVGFNYGTTSTYVFETGSTELSTTPISPVILAGTFSQFFVSPSPDSLTLKTGLKFNAQTGQITGTPNVLTSTTEVSKPITFTITGVTTANKAASATVSFIVNDKKPVFSYTYSGSFSTKASVGNLLTPVVSGTSGVIKKYRLAPTSPALPAGLTLDSTNGKIQGTATEAANLTLVVRGINTGGYTDVNLPLVINTNPDAPQVRYMMSLFSGNVVDTICPALTSGNTIYLTKPDSYGGLNVYMTPVVTAGQTGSYTVTPAFESGATKENLSLNAGTGVVSGTPGQFTTSSTPSHTISIANAASVGPAGSFTMNIVANAPFFTYNSGSTTASPNIYMFVQGQPVDVANGAYPGYTANGLKPAGGSGVVSYTIYPLSSSAPVFSTTGLTFNTTTGAISGTPTTNTGGFSNYGFWDYAVVGKKADGSFTVYKIRIKIYKTPSEWNS